MPQWTAGVGNIVLKMVNGGEEVYVRNGVAIARDADAAASSSSVTLTGDVLLSGSITGGSPDTLVSAPKGAVYIDTGSGNDTYINTDGSTAWSKMVD